MSKILSFLRKSLILSVLLAAFVAGSSATARAESAEAWKGQVADKNLSAGFLTGMGILDASAGFSLMGTAAMRIVQQGFVPELNNSVWVELAAGPLFVQGSSSLMYSAHLRWDFIKDDEWGFYALGGLGGNITSEKLGSRFILLPRFGIGALARIRQEVSLRAELSHEFIGIGATFFF